MELWRNSAIYKQRQEQKTDRRRALRLAQSMFPNVSFDERSNIQVDAEKTGAFVEGIVYVSLSESRRYTYEPDNCQEIIAWLRELGAFYECTLCGGTGEYETEYGPKGCNLCNSRLIPVLQPNGSYEEADWGDEIHWDAATRTARVIHSGDGR